MTTIMECFQSNCRLTGLSRLSSSSFSAVYFDLICPGVRRSRPFQRGAAQRRTCNERPYLAAIIWLRLRRAEHLVLARYSSTKRLMVFCIFGRGLDLVFGVVGAFSTLLLIAVFK